MFMDLEADPASCEGLFKEVKDLLCIMLLYLSLFVQRCALHWPGCNVECTSGTNVVIARDLPVTPGLQVKYYVTGCLEDKVQAALEAGGAKKTAYLSGINTHCLVGQDPDYNEVWMVW